MQKISKCTDNFYTKGSILCIMFYTFFHWTIYHGNHFTSTGTDMPPKGTVNVNTGFVTEKKKPELWIIIF